VGALAFADRHTAPRSFVNLAIVCRERSMASLARWISSAELLSSLSVSVTSFGAFLRLLLVCHHANHATRVRAKASRESSVEMWATFRCRDCGRAIVDWKGVYGSTIPTVNYSAEAPAFDLSRVLDYNPRCHLPRQAKAMCPALSVLGFTANS